MARPEGGGGRCVPSGLLTSPLPQVIFGKSSCSEFTREAFTPVVYHNKYVGLGGWGSSGQLGQEEGREGSVLGCYEEMRGRSVGWAGGNAAPSRAPRPALAGHPSSTRSSNCVFPPA